MGERRSIRSSSSLAWVTDLGCSTLVKERIRQASILVIESNHCTEMLEQDQKRPWSLKQRIGMVTYPINPLSSFWNPWKTQVEKDFLMHLSKDCNDVNLVRERFGKLPGQGSRFSTFVIDPAPQNPSEYETHRTPDQVDRHHGPATESESNIRKLIEQRVDVMRLNMAHAQHDWIREVTQRIRKIGEELGHERAFSWI